MGRRGYGRRWVDLGTHRRSPAAVHTWKQVGESCPFEFHNRNSRLHSGRREGEQGTMAEDLDIAPPQAQLHGQGCVGNKQGSGALPASDRSNVQP